MLKALLLAAGKGTRLKPFTNSWPKCLMPINGVPLLEYWLDLFRNLGIQDVLINLHHLAPEVEKFLSRPKFKDWVTAVYEQELAGTAGTIRNNINFLSGSTILLAHADNFCITNFNDFINYHLYMRPKNCPITMMTFDCLNPQSCGIVEIDKNRVVRAFYEKVQNPPGRIANGAVYLLEPEVINLIYSDINICDFSVQVIPKYLNRIVAWHNCNIHRDIGTIKDLCEVHNYFSSSIISNHNLTHCKDAWRIEFDNHQIHKEIKNRILI